MKLVQFISDEGVTHEVSADSEAASVMQNDSRFKLVGKIEEQPNTEPNTEPEIAGKIEEQVNAEPEIATQSADTKNSVITAKMMKEIEEVKVNQTWRDLGFASFAKYVDSPAVPQMNSSRYYKLRKVLREKGAVFFNKQKFR